MSELTHTLNQLQRAFEGDAWSGPSLLATLEGLSAAQAAAHPLPGAHSIGELVCHLTTWAATVAQRIIQQQSVPTVAADWPEFPAGAGEEVWQLALQELRAAHQHLLAVAAALPENTLHVPTGTGVSNYVWLHGTAQHYLYHAGQIVLLRKLL